MVLDQKLGLINGSRQSGASLPRDAGEVHNVSAALKSSVMSLQRNGRVSGEQRCFLPQEIG